MSRRCLGGGRLVPIHTPGSRSWRNSQPNSGTDLARNDGQGEIVMLYWAFVFLVIALFAGLLGFTTIAGASIAIAKVLAGLFLLVFVVLLIMGLGASRRV